MPSPPTRVAPPLPRPDPRMRARWVEVRRRKGRRRLRVVMAALALTTVVGGGFAALHSPLLAVRHIQLTGGAGLTRAEVAAAAGVRSDTPMIDVSTGGAGRRIAALSLVATASVRRSWPDTLRIGISERQAVAEVSHAVPGEPNAVVLVDASGRVTTALASPRAGLISLSGVTLPAAAASHPVGAWLVASPGAGATPGSA
ncbi:MAG: cell division protein FtsQ/DivIB, partial [Acidimicrobiales bacterium]